MPKITAWQCPHTGELFDDKKLYQSHLRKLGRSRLYERKQQALKEAKLKVFSDIRNTVTDFTELRKAILEHQDVFIRNGRDREWVGYRSHPELKLVDIEFSGMTFSHQVSNSHDCPFNGVTNWYRKPELPRGYPGWSGRLWIALSHEPAFFGSELFEGTGIHTGTGGATGNIRGTVNTYCLQWDVKLFLDDWPGLSRQVVWNTLKGEKV